MLEEASPSTQAVKFEFLDKILSYTTKIAKTFYSVQVHVLVRSAKNRRELLTPPHGTRFVDQCYTEIMSDLLLRLGSLKQFTLKNMGFQTNFFFGCGFLKF
jgi:hypothetical protein